MKSPCNATIYCKVAMKAMITMNSIRQYATVPSLSTWWRRREIKEGLGRRKADLMEKSRVDDDAVYEILLRLPVKTLKRFQCACKSWLSLISSPQFQKDHFRRAQQNPPHFLTLHQMDFPKMPTLSFSSYKNNKGALILLNNFSKIVSEIYFNPLTQSCIGLVCVYEVLFTLPIFICNPATEELISLPRCNGSNSCVGIGYVTSTEEYKVARFSNVGSNNLCQVFTLGTGSWREVGTLPFHACKGPAPFLRGALHVLPNISYQGVKVTDHIAALDIESEEYREAIPLPAYYYSLGDCEDLDIANVTNFMHLSKLRGSLCLTFVFGQSKCYLELWLLKDYYNGEWVKEYAIDISTFYPYPSYSFSAYPTDTVGDDIMLNFSDEEGVRVLSYDPLEGSVKIKKDKEWAATFYTETFYSLRSK